MNNTERKEVAPGQKGHVLILALGIPMGGIAGAGIGILAGHMRSALAQTAWAAAAVLIIGIGTGMLIGYRIGRWRHCKTCLYRELWNPERPFEALKAAMASWDEVEPKKDEMDGITKIFLEKAKQDIAKRLYQYFEDNPKGETGQFLPPNTYVVDQALRMINAIDAVSKGEAAFPGENRERR